MRETYNNHSKSIQVQTKKRVKKGESPVKKGIMFLVFVAALGCKTATSSNGSRTKNDGPEAATPSSASTLQGISYGLDKGAVVAYGKCPDSKSLDAEDATLTASGCEEVSRMPLAEFREKFIAAYEKSTGHGMTAAQKDLLKLVGSVDPLIQRKLHRYAQIYGNIVSDVFGLNRAVKYEAPAQKSGEQNGFGLAQSDIVIDINMQTPFGSPTNSPTTFLGPRQADRIRVEVMQDVPNCSRVVPLMVYIGDNSLGNLKRAVTLSNVYEFESNFPGRRLRYSNLMFQVSQQQWSTVLCHYRVTEILNDGPTHTDPPPPIHSACEQEIAALCPPGQVDQCTINPNGSHICVANPNPVDPLQPPPGPQGFPPPVFNACQPSFNQFVMAQPSFDWHGGDGTIDYSVNGACISEIKVDWPGCGSAGVTEIWVRESNGQRTQIATHGRRNGNYDLGRNMRVNRVDVTMHDDRNFRFVGCQVDLLVQ